MRLAVNNDVSDEYVRGVIDGLIASLTAVKSCHDEQYINVGSLRSRINEAINEASRLVED